MSSAFMDYRRELARLLADPVLSRALEHFAAAYPSSRDAAFAALDRSGLIKEVSALRLDAAARLDKLMQSFRSRAEAGGARVRAAEDAVEAGDVVAAVARERGARKIVKSKSMTSEEIGLNKRLESEGLDVVETDLGEWILQLRGEGPTHMVMPAIHLTREQVAELFTQVTGVKQPADIATLVAVARKELRRAFFAADMAITGANFALASTGAMAMVTNEGNGRMVATLPPTHLALFGLDKLLPNLAAALKVLRVLPRSATGQAITTYVSWFSAPVPCASAPRGHKALYAVVLDNGRSALAKDPVLSKVLSCVRCGSCANVCPVFRMVGGHGFGHIYVGPVGVILTHAYHDAKRGELLAANCLQCGRCAEACPAGIDLPGLIRELRTRKRASQGAGLAGSLASAVLQRPNLFHGALRMARPMLRLASRGPEQCATLPRFLDPARDVRALPAPRSKPFRDQAKGVLPDPARPRARVLLFGGCVPDYLFPDQLVAAAQLAGSCNVALAYPQSQSCCGLPLAVKGDAKGASRLAKAVLRLFDPAECDAVLTLCPSCAQHLRHGIPALVRDTPLEDRALALADRVVDLGTFLARVCGLSQAHLLAEELPVAYHAPCHLRGVAGGPEESKEILSMAGLTPVPYAGEDLCCGFGGSYGLDFPMMSGAMLGRKLAGVGKSEAQAVVTDCPGCVLQLRGGAARHKLGLPVLHLAEILASRLRD